MNFHRSEQLFSSSPYLLRISPSPSKKLNCTLRPTSALGRRKPISPLCVLRVSVVKPGARDSFRISL